MNTITLVINDDEMSSLYHIIKRARKYQSGRIDSKSAEWMSKLSEAYRSMKKYNLVFRGQDAVVLLSLCDNYREHYSKDDEYGVLANQIVDMAEPDRAERILREQAEAIEADRIHEEEVREQNRRENEQQEQMQRERLELQRRASAGDAWDTGDTGVNDGVWDAGDSNDSWDTEDDMPY